MLMMRFPGRFTFAENSLERRHIHGIARVHFSVDTGNPGYFGMLEDYSRMLENTKFASRLAETHARRDVIPNNR